MTTTRARQWIVTAKPNPTARLRFFCFPYAGGSALTFRRWPEFLPQSVEICAVQLPGRGSRMHEPPFSSISSLIPVLAQVLAQYRDMPMAFFGHSMGGIIAFELARYLRREHDRSVAHLFVSGSRAPQVQFDEPSTFDLPDPEFVEELRALNGTPQEVLEYPELLELMIPLLRADFALCETYQYYPERPLDCPITVLGGLRDRAMTREDLEAWREQTTASFSLRMLPGDHFFIRTAQPLLSQVLAQDLARLI